MVYLLRSQQTFAEIEFGGFLPLVADSVLAALEGDDAGADKLKNAELTQQRP